MIHPTTPSQTVGPYFAIGLPFPGGPEVVPPSAPGAMRVHGTVLDGAGAPIGDHLLEVWQADADGRLADLHLRDDPPADPAFRGFARCGAEVGDGTFAITTVKPGRLPGPGGALQAPHLLVSLFARGFTDRLVTRMYFADEPEANAEDPVLALVPAARRETLLAVPDADGYRWDIRVQGDGETVFLDL